MKPVPAKILPRLLVGLGAVLACTQWWQLVYRLQLFYREYHHEPYANHVGDDVFVFIHVINGVLLLMGGFSFWAFGQASARERWLAIGCTAANLVAWLGFIYMRATGMLVGYTEFIQHGKGL